MSLDISPLLKECDLGFLCSCRKSINDDCEYMTLSIYIKEGLCCGVVDKEDEFGYDAMNRLMREQRQSNSGTETLMLRTWSFGRGCAKRTGKIWMWIFGESQT